MSDVTAAHAPGLDRRVLIAFPGLMLAIFLAALDQTIVATALPTIARELNGLSYLSWVNTSYLLTCCISIPIYGRAGDLFDRKRPFLAAIVIFVVGSVLCGASTSIVELAAFRALQGLGAGGLIVGVQAIIGDLVPPAERGRYQGFLQATFAVATLAGPLAGGVLTEGIGWRWAFYVNVPFGLAALVVTTFVLRVSRNRSSGRFDWPGAAVLSGGVTAALLVAGLGGTSYPWISTPIIVLLAVAIVLLTVFVAVEKRASKPLLPLGLIVNRVVGTSAAMDFLVGFASFATVTFIPVYQEIVDGASPTTSGLRLAPLVLCMLATSVVTGQLVARLGRYRPFPIAGALTLVAGFALLTQFGAETTEGYQLLTLTLVGVGFGMITPITILAAQNAAGRENLGAVSAIATFSRTVGGAAGVAVLGAVYNGSSTVPGNAVRWVFLSALVVVVIILILSLFLPEQPLRRRETQGSQRAIEVAHDE